MKLYQKPELKFNEVVTSKGIANLSDWLKGAGSEYENAGITTYVIES